MEQTTTGSPPPADQTVKEEAPAKYCADLIEKAELLLRCAADSGINVEDPVRRAVIGARQANDRGGLSADQVDRLFIAMTKLAADLKPVTVESLTTGEKEKGEARKKLKAFGIAAVLTGLIIIVVSLGIFVSSKLAEKINTDIEDANALLSKLRVQLGPSLPASPNSETNGGIGTNQVNLLSADNIWWGSAQPPAGISDKDVISDLQQFAATMRQIEGYARQLNHFIRDAVPDPFGPNTNKGSGIKRLELTPGLAVKFSQELTDRAEEYQSVRSFANRVLEEVTVYYGAVATCILPVLYALLGAGAYLLRTLEEQLKNKTFVPGDRHFPHFLIAGIAGLVIGRFDNLTQGISISPFALAFLVGYAVDVFFSLLEGLIQNLKRAFGASATQAGPRKGQN
jgi:hypothetical protein